MGALTALIILSGCSSRYNTENFIIESEAENNWDISSSMIDDKDFVVTDEKIIIKADFLFDFNRWDIKENAKPKIVSLLPYLKDKRLFIVGHTDELGSQRYNFELGAKRAKSMRNYLMSLGLNGADIRTYSAGENLPVVTNCKKGDIKCLAPNRRVEIMFKNPKLGDMQ